jgi:signal transduction histidine kinase
VRRLAFALLALALAMHAGAWLVSDDLASSASEVGWTAAAAFAVLGLADAARRCHDDERRIWTALAGAAALWLIGQIAWDLYSATGRTPPTPGLADILWLAFPVLTAVGLYRHAPATSRVRWILDLDAVTLGIGVGAVTVALNWPELAASTIPLPAKITSIAYPVLYSVAIAAAVGALVGAPEVLRRVDVQLVVAGVVAEGVAFSLWCPQILQGTWVQGSSLLDPLWSFGLLLMGAGGHLVRTDARLVSTASQRIRRRTFLPAAVIGGLVATLALLDASHGSLALELIVLGALGAVGLLVVARNWFAFGVIEELEAEQRETLARRNRELEAFAYSASHDLKAPLVSIHGFAGMLERELDPALDDRTRHLLKRIEANAESMQVLISDLFSFARSGIDERGADAVDTTAIASEVVAEWHDRAEAAGVPLVLDGPLPSVRAHPVRLKQALTNLVDNALRYGDGHVRVSGSSHDGVAEIVVSDGGSGIPLDERATAFDAFSRGRGAVGAAPDGAGFGLALVKRIVEASGGDVRYEHAAGARFVLSFPTGAR